MEVIERIKEDIKKFGANKPCAVFYEVAVGFLPWNSEPNLLQVCTDYVIIEEGEELPANSILSYLGGALKVFENQDYK